MNLNKRPKAPVPMPVPVKNDVACEDNLSSFGDLLCNLETAIDDETRTFADTNI